MRFTLKYDEAGKERVLLEYPVYLASAPGLAPLSECLAHNTCP